MDSEVLVYIQKIKNFLNTNDSARDYFIGNSDVDEFYKQLTIISEKNYESNGQPELTKEQFELLRVTLEVVAISQQKMFITDDGLFMVYENYPPISLN
jgi:hypothetical protein